VWAERGRACLVRVICRSSCGDYQGHDWSIAPVARALAMAVRMPRDGPSGTPVRRRGGGRRQAGRGMSLVLA